MSTESDQAHLAFFSVLLGLWLLWFIRRRDIAALTGILLAGAGAIVALGPLAVGYSRTHAQYGLQRSLNEILRYSADATSLLTAHSSLRLWGWTSRWSKSEAELFPGATILLLVGAGVILALARRPARDRLDRLSVWLLPLAGVFAAVAAAGWAFAPWRIEVPGLTMASNAPFKPMTLAVVVVSVWVGSASWMRAAYARRSAFGFYTLAAGLLFLCSLGPKPTIAGHQFLYEPPYAWLMHLRMFASVRVPARFGMLVMLALATAGALAFHHFRLPLRMRRLLVFVLVAGIVVDGWSWALPLPAVPEMWPAARASGYAAVLELPLGDVAGDLASIYRATRHERPVVNGNSGFEPTHYFALKTALAEHDPTALEWLPPATPVLVVLDRLGRNAVETERFLAQQPHAAALASDQRWGFYALELPATSSTPCSGTATPITSVWDARGPVDPGLLTDGNPRTRWFTPQSQRAGDTLVVELGRASSPCAVLLGLGEFGNSYPRKLIVETSEDAASWTVVATQRTAGATIRAGLDDPRQVRVRIPVATNRARFVRLRLDEAHIEVPWQITELTVLSE